MSNFALAKYCFLLTYLLIKLDDRTFFIACLHMETVYEICYIDIEVDFLFHFNTAHIIS